MHALLQNRRRFARRAIPKDMPMRGMVRVTISTFGAYQGVVKIPSTSLRITLDQLGR